MAHGGRGWWGVGDGTDTPTPLAKMTAAERSRPPSEDILHAGGFFLIPRIHRGKAEKMSLFN